MYNVVTEMRLTVVVMLMVVAMQHHSLGRLFRNQKINHLKEFHGLMVRLRQGCIL